MALKIRLIADHFTDDQLYKVNQAVAKIEKALNSDQFKDWCFGFNYKIQECSGMWWWKKCKETMVDHFAYTKLSNNDVYFAIMAGKEPLSPEPQGVADIHLRIDPGNRRGVIGYTYPNDPYQYIYKHFFDTFTVDELADNVCHEMMHKFEFEHPFSYCYERQFSVPYAAGKYVEGFEG